MSFSVDQAVKYTRHETREVPRIYHKIGKGYFCDIHASGVWCKYCIVPIAWCPYWETGVITCDLCKPALWKALLERNSDNSDYELEWESPHSNNSKRIQNMAENIHDLGESTTNSTNTSPTRMDKQSPTNIRIPSPMGSFPCCLEDGYSQQLLQCTEEHFEQRNPDIIPKPADKPQEQKHFDAQRRSNLPSTEQNRHISGSNTGQSTPSTSDWISKGPRKLFTDDYILVNRKE